MSVIMFIEGMLFAALVLKTTALLCRKINLKPRTTDMIEALKL